MKVSLNATLYCHGDGKLYTAQQAVSLLPLEPGGALMLSHTATSEEEALQGLALKLAGHVSKCGATEITVHDTAVEVKDMGGGVVTTRRGELAGLMDAARKRAEEATEHFVGTPPPVPVRRLEVVIDDYLHGILAAALEALKPLASIADAYHANGLDEARPEWIANGAQVFDPDAELYCGRGGKRLLTLQHALDAKNVLEKGASEGIPNVALYRQVLMEIMNKSANSAITKLRDIHRMAKETLK